MCWRYMMSVSTEIDQTLQGLPDDTLVTVVHLMNRFIRHSISTKTYDELRDAGGEPAATGLAHDIALGILREIEREAGAPINELKDDRIEIYITSIDRILWERVGQR